MQVSASPRVRRRQRREQLLQEHKTLGREIVLTALKKEEKIRHMEVELEKEVGDVEQRRVNDNKEEVQLRKMLGEREEEIGALRAACEAWRQKTITSEKELAEANFTVDKLER